MLVPTEEKRVYSIVDVAEMLQINRQTAYDWARRGIFPTRRIGRRLLVPKDEFDKWFASPEAMQTPT